MMVIYWLNTWSILISWEPLMVKLKTVWTCQIQHLIIKCSLYSQTVWDIYVNLLEKPHSAAGISNWPPWGNLLSRTWEVTVFDDRVGHHTLKSTRVLEAWEMFYNQKGVSTSIRLHTKPWEWQMMQKDVSSYFLKIKLWIRMSAHWQLTCCQDCNFTIFSEIFWQITVFYDPF